MAIIAEAEFIDSKGTIKTVTKEFKSHDAAEEWVRKMMNNDGCIYVGCPSLAFIMC